MSFVTLTVYKLDNLRNQLMNNRLLVSPRFIALANCQYRVGRPMQPVLHANGRVNSVEVRSAYSQTDPMEWMPALVEKKKSKKRPTPFGRTDADSLIRLASSDNIVESPCTLLRGRRVQWASRNS